MSNSRISILMAAVVHAAIFSIPTHAAAPVTISDVPVFGPNGVDQYGLTAKDWEEIGRRTGSAGAAEWFNERIRQVSRHASSNPDIGSLDVRQLLALSELSTQSDLNGWTNPGITPDMVNAVKTLGNLEGVHVYDVTESLPFERMREGAYSVQSNAAEPTYSDGQVLSALRKIGMEKPEKLAVAIVKFRSENPDASLPDEQIARVLLVQRGVSDPQDSTLRYITRQVSAILSDAAEKAGMLPWTPFSFSNFPAAPLWTSSQQAAVSNQTSRFNSAGVNVAAVEAALADAGTESNGLTLYRDDVDSHKWMSENVSDPVLREQLGTALPLSRESILGILSSDDPKAEIAGIYRSMGTYSTVEPLGDKGAVVLSVRDSEGNVLDNRTYFPPSSWGHAWNASDAAGVREFLGIYGVRTPSDLDFSRATVLAKFDQNPPKGTFIQSPSAQYAQYGLTVDPLTGKVVGGGSTSAIDYYNKYGKLPPPEFVWASPNESQAQTGSTVPASRPVAFNSAGVNVAAVEAALADAGTESNGLTLYRDDVDSHKWMSENVSDPVLREQLGTALPLSRESILGILSSDDPKAEIAGIYRSMGTYSTVEPDGKSGGRIVSIRDSEGNVLSNVVIASDGWNASRSQEIFDKLSFYGVSIPDGLKLSGLSSLDRLDQNPPKGTFIQSPSAQYAQYGLTVDPLTGKVVGGGSTSAIDYYNKYGNLPPPEFVWAGDNGTHSNVVQTGGNHPLTVAGTSVAPTSSSKSYSDEEADSYVRSEGIGNAARMDSNELKAAFDRIADTVIRLRARGENVPSEQVAKALLNAIPASHREKYAASITPQSVEKYVNARMESAPRTTVPETSVRPNGQTPVPTPVRSETPTVRTSVDSACISGICGINAGIVRQLNEALRNEGGTYSRTSVANLISIQEGLDSFVSMNLKNPAKIVEFARNNNVSASQLAAAYSNHAWQRVTEQQIQRYVTNTLWQEALGTIRDTVSATSAAWGVPAAVISAKQQASAVRQQAALEKYRQLQANKALNDAQRHSEMADYVNGQRTSGLTDGEVWAAIRASGETSVTDSDVSGYMDGYQSSNGSTNSAGQSSSRPPSPSSSARTNTYSQEEVNAWFRDIGRQFNNVANPTADAAKEAVQNLRNEGKVISNEQIAEAARNSGIEEFRNVTSKDVQNYIQGK